MVASVKTRAVCGLAVALALAFTTSPVSSFAAEQPNLNHWGQVLMDAKADTPTRMEAARKMGETKDPKHLPQLTDALRDSNKAVRWAAVAALWDLGDKGAVPALIEYLEKGEGYEWGKVLTMNALGSLQDPRAVDPLLKMLKSENPFLRRSAALALVRIGNVKAIPGIIELLNDEQGWLQRLAQQLLLELTAGNIPGERPKGYEAWVKWYQGNAGRLKIERVRKE